MLFMDAKLASQPSNAYVHTCRTVFAGSAYSPVGKKLYHTAYAQIGPILAFQGVG